MLNFTNSSEMRNLYAGARAEMHLIFNAHNSIAGNRFENCGRHPLHRPAQRNLLSDNAFIGNRTQVMYVGTRFVEWSDSARGNFSSDHPARPRRRRHRDASRPNDLMTTSCGRSRRRSLLGSPAVQLARWSQAAFPAILPRGVTDSHPLMQPVEIARARSYRRARDRRPSRLVPQRGQRCRP